MSFMQEGNASTELDDCSLEVLCLQLYLRGKSAKGDYEALCWMVQSRRL
jgi:hypothetical protein